MIEKNLDGYINEWGPDLLAVWTEASKPKDDYGGMMRTALISVCRVREAREAQAEAQASMQQVPDQTKTA